MSGCVFGGFLIPTYSSDTQEYLHNKPQTDFMEKDRRKEERRNPWEIIRKECKDFDKLSASLLQYVPQCIHQDGGWHSRARAANPDPLQTEHN